MCKSSLLPLESRPKLIGTCLSVRIIALNLNILPIKMNYVCDMFFASLQDCLRKKRRSSRRRTDKAKFYFMEEKFPRRKVKCAKWKIWKRWEFINNVTLRLKNLDFYGLNLHLKAGEKKILKTLWSYDSIWIMTRCWTCSELDSFYWIFINRAFNLNKLY